MSRTFGETKNCAGCRYWSEMLAQAVGGGPVQAMCLGDGKYRSRYVSARQSCDRWASGDHGAVDDPYFDPTDAYAEDDAQAPA